MAVFPLLRRTDFNPVSIWIVDKVNPHIRIFKADAVHFFVEFKRRVHIIRLKGKVEFVVPQIIWPVHVAKQMCIRDSPSPLPSPSQSEVR